MIEAKASGLRTLIAACAVALATPGLAAPGSLVIVGGALSPGNDAVWRAFIDRARGRPIAVIAAASGEPAGSADDFAKALIARGVAASRIATIHIAVVDDPDTKDVDEARWAAGGSDPAEIARVHAAGAIWFTGGDQRRVTKVLLGTPMLAELRARLAGGAVIGGTSAGAAIMSATMITGGDSLGALTGATNPSDDEDAEGVAVGLAPGLGFLPYGLIDQHFDRRARLGRLARALARLPVAERMGFGIDEDSALVVDLATGHAQAIGRGSVTVLDARRATLADAAPFAATGIRLGLANGGDAVDMATATVGAAADKAAIVRAATAAPDRGGMALATLRLDDDLGRHLAGTGVLERTSLLGPGIGVTYRFDATDARGWRGGGRYGVDGVLLAIRPAAVTVIPR